MKSNDKLTQLNNLLDQAQSVLVILDAEAKFDQKVSAASLFLSLKEKGKKVELLSPEPIANGTIYGLDSLKTRMGNKNLLVSFDYDEKSVSKVSYHIDEENQKFYLTIKPKTGEESLDPETVEFEKTGTDADLIFFMGVKRLEDLGQLYYGYEQAYRDAAKIAVSQDQTEFADITLNINEFSCFSEAVTRIIQAANLGLSTAIATNLFAGINYETNQFSSLSADAKTFEAAADLIRAGAKRQTQSQVSQKSIQTKQAQDTRKQQADRKKEVKPHKPKVVSKQQPSSQQSKLAEKDQPVKKEESSPSPVRPSGLRV
jgi:hypothetical protein